MKKKTLLKLLFIAFVVAINFLILTKVSLEGTENNSTIYNIISCLVIDVLALVIILKSHNIIEMVNDVKSSRTLMLNLAKNDFKTKYAGSYLGIFWAFVQPVITILVYWFVFGIGLKSGDVGDIDRKSVV